MENSTLQRHSLPSSAFDQAVSVPLGVHLALLLVSLAAAAGLVLIPLYVYELRRRCGPIVQRILLGPIAVSVIVALPVLVYWNVLGLH